MIVEIIIIRYILTMKLTLVFCLLALSFAVHVQDHLEDEVKQLFTEASFWSSFKATDMADKATAKKFWKGQSDNMATDCVNEGKAEAAKQKCGADDKACEFTQKMSLQMLKPLCDMNGQIITDGTKTVWENCSEQLCNSATDDACKEKCKGALKTYYETLEKEMQKQETETAKTSSTA